MTAIVRPSASEYAELLAKYTDPDTCPSDSLEARPLVEEPAFVSWQQDIPRAYLDMSPAELDRRIAAARAKLGRKLVILGHHYQRDEVIKYADFTGDSFKLARHAADQAGAEYVLFCGVHFMAESADILTDESVKVILPNMAAGCSMADMADPDDVYAAWDEIHEALGDGASVVPVTYMNSAASLKAFVGERGGLVCTSSNAAATFSWARERGDRILFMPDQHLGRNTAYKMGVPLADMVVWDPNEIWGGLDPEQVRRARIILWKGHCSVHTRFAATQIQALRRRHPNLRVIVHPECTWDVVQAADDSGSTEYIIRTVTDSPDGSVWAVGTEIHLVNRLANAVAPAKAVLSLDQFGCLCSTMFRVSPNHLLWVLEGLVDGEVHNRIVVPEEQKHWTRVALDRMLSIQ